jgi:hypothetical protein
MNTKAAFLTLVFCTTLTAANQAHALFGLGCSPSSEKSAFSGKDLSDPAVMTQYSPLYQILIQDVEHWDKTKIQRYFNANEHQAISNELLANLGNASVTEIGFMLSNSIVNSPIRDEKANVIAAVQSLSIRRGVAPVLVLLDYLPYSRPDIDSNVKEEVVLKAIADMVPDLKTSDLQIAQAFSAKAGYAGFRKADALIASELGKR